MLQSCLPLYADMEPALQYVEFLSSALSSEAYSSMLPSITDLVQIYQLDIEVALQVPVPCNMSMRNQKLVPETGACSVACLPSQYLASATVPWSIYSGKNLPTPSWECPC